MCKYFSVCLARNGWLGLTRRRSSQNVTPRGLSSQGDESSEFVSGEESEGDDAPAQYMTAGGTEDEMRRVSESEEEADQTVEEVAAEFENMKAVNGVTETAETAPEPEAEFDFAGMIARSDETVARIMRGYSSLPSRSRLQEEAVARDEEEIDEEDEEEEHEGWDESGVHVDQQDEETQVVQDSVALDTAAGLPTPDALGEDSRHGSMESENQSDRREPATEAPHALVQEINSHASRSQDRMSAVEETVRRIQVERTNNREFQSASGIAEEAVQIEIPPAPAPGEPESPDRLAYKADRKQRKKVRQAHLKEWRKTAPAPSPRVRGAPASVERKQHKLPSSVPDLNDVKFWQSKLWDAQKKMMMLEKRTDRSAVKERKKMRRRAARANEKLRRIKQRRGAPQDAGEEEGGVELEA